MTIGAARRRRLLSVLITAGMVLFVAAAVGVAVYRDARTSTAGTLQFDQPLTIPPLLHPRTDASGRKVFDLRLQSGSTKVVRGGSTETWGANAAHLGPTLRAARGDRVLLRVHNRLGEPTTLHWHGMQLPARVDGGPHQIVAPARTWKPRWTIDQPAATLWYHPHPHGASEDHVYRGVAGLFVIDDDNPAATSLPHEYGRDDIPLIIQDKRLHDDGSLDFSQHPISPVGRLGDKILVNGTLAPHHTVRDERVRLRLLNGSTARVYNIGFADDREFQLIASDGGLLPRPLAAKRIQLSPGERAEIVAAFAARERVVLRSHPPDLSSDFWHERFSGGDDTLDLLELRAAARLAPAPEPPSRLANVAALPARDAVATRRFELAGSSQINGRRIDMARVDAIVEPDSVEIWVVRNAGRTPHSFHIHGVQFQVRADARQRPPVLHGWKDTVYVPPGESLRLVVRMPAYGDPAVAYMFHCHLLEHEDRGMMGQFLVVRRQPTRSDRALGSRGDGTRGRRTGRGPVERAQRPA